MNSEEATQNPKFQIVFKRSAYEELKRLDNSVKPKVLAQLLKLQENPLAGEPLGNKRGINLTGYRKIYVDKGRLRIVWQVRLDKVVVVILGIGPRDKGEIYRLVADRLKEQEMYPSEAPAKRYGADQPPESG